MAISKIPNLPFIVSTDRQKVDPETRKLIRSHVMRGKNRLKPKKKPRNVVQAQKTGTGPLVTANSVWPTKVPRFICSELSTIRFAGSVEPALIADVLSFSTIFNKAMFLLEACISADTVGLTQMCFQPMLFDEAYLYAACITIQAYFDGLFNRSRSPEGQRRDGVYYAKTIRILQERLSLGDNEKFSDSTVMTILMLSGHAYTTGDFESVDYHNRGLLKLVSMRGVQTFFQNIKLSIEIIRSDLNTALDTGVKPALFARDNIPWPLIPNSGFRKMFDEDEEVESLSVRLNPELTAVWTTIFNFCALVNTAAATPKKEEAQVTEQMFLHYMGAIMYRLLHQQFTLGSLDEAFRQGLLAFSSPIFLHWCRIELPDPRFTAAYRRALSKVDWVGSDAVPSRERLWLLMVAAMSMAHEPSNFSWLAPQLRTAIEMYEVSTWDELSDLLASVMWVGLIYDRPGREIFDLVMTRSAHAVCMIYEIEEV